MDGMKTNKTKENIEQYGWEAMYVFDEYGEKEPFLYTIGLCETYSHPEIMIFGLARETMHNIISDVVNDIKNGFHAPLDTKIKGMLSGDLEVVFKKVKSSNHREYLGHAQSYYNKPFDALVMFWPDKNGVFPTEQNCEITHQSEALKIV